MSPVVLQLDAVSKIYSVRQGLFAGKQDIAAVRDLSLEVEEGQVMGLVGESGCGKSTAVRLMLGLEAPTRGRVLLDGAEIAGLNLRDRARRIQPVFQNPHAALNPVRTIHDTVALPLRLHGIEGDHARLVRDMLDLVGMPARLGDAYPSELSGGQRQRVAIARALILKPRILICDEPTSALDVSVQAQIVNLLLSLQREFGLTMVLVSHSLAIVEHMAQQVCVMYLGEKAEQADTQDLFREPRHPYSRALLGSALSADPRVGRPAPQLAQGGADVFARASGCLFAPRCPIAEDQCHARHPELRRVGASQVRCHLA